MNTGLKESDIFALAISEGNLFAGLAYGSVWRRPLSDFGISAVVEKPSDIHGEISLSQNYPNPATPTTNIEYSLVQSGNVSLKIFDLLGKEIAIFVNGEVSFGLHIAQWQPQGLPSGVYFYRLQQGNRFETKQLILTR